MTSLSFSYIQEIGITKRMFLAEFVDTDNSLLYSFWRGNDERLHAPSLTSTLLGSCGFALFTFKKRHASPLSRCLTLLGTKFSHSLSYTGLIADDMPKESKTYFLVGFQ